MVWVSCEGETAADKGGLISEGISTSVPLPKKGAPPPPRVEILNKLFNVMSRKFKFSAQGSDLAPFIAHCHFRIF